MTSLTSLGTGAAGAEEGRTEGRAEGRAGGKEEEGDGGRSETRAASAEKRKTRRRPIASKVRGGTGEDLEENKGRSSNGPESRGTEGELSGGRERVRNAAREAGERREREREVGGAAVLV